MERQSISQYQSDNDNENKIKNENKNVNENENENLQEMIGDLQFKQELKSQKEKNSTFMIMQILFKLNIGAGILGLPITFQKTSYEIGIPVFIILSLLVFYSNIMLIRLTEYYKNGVNWQSEMIEEDFGEKAKNIFIVFTCISSYGSPAGYLLLLFNFFDYVIFHNEDRSQIGFNHKAVYILIALYIIIPIILFNKFQFYAKISIIANIFIISCLIIIIAQSYRYQQPFNKQVQKNDFEPIGLLIGVTMFAYNQPVHLPTLKSAIDTPNKFQTGSLLTLIIVSITYLTFSVICSYNFNESTDQIILFSLPRSLFSSFIQVLYSLALIISFPIILLTAFQQMETIEIILNYLEPQSTNFFLKRSLLRLIQVFFITFIAIFIPDFTSFLSLMGSLSFIIQAYLFPMISFYKRVSHKISIFSNIVYFMFQSIGFIASGYSFVFSIIKLTRGFF